MKRLMMTLAIVLAANLSCKDQNEVTLKFTVQDNQHAAISDAKVFVNGQFIGATDAQGILQSIQPLQKNSNAKIEIRKESAKYYYAPYFDNFLVNTEDAMALNLKATLYFVPKPTPEDQALASSATNTPAPEKPAENFADSKPTTEPAKSEQPPEPIKIPDNLAEMDQDEEADQTSENKPAENLPQAQADNSPSNPVRNREPLPPKTKLMIRDEKPLDLPADTVTETKSEPPSNATIFSIYAEDKGNPIANAVVSYGYTDEGNLMPGCTTNARGRCVIRFASKPLLPVTFHIEKTGHQSTTRMTRVTNQGKLKIQMPKGQSLEILALTQRSNYTRGLSNVEVFIQGKRQGITDEFGHFSYFHKGKDGDLIEVVLKPQSHLPDNYTTDLVMSGSMTLTKHFTTKLPPKIKIALTPTHASGDLSSPYVSKMLLKADKEIAKLLKANLLSNQLFQETAGSFVQKKSSELGRTITDLLKSGWRGTPLEQQVDALLQPTIIFGEVPSLELAIVGSSGNIIAAAKDAITSQDDTNAFARATADIALNLIKTYPFEGALIKKVGDKITTNFGTSLGIPIKKGDTLLLYGSQADRYGKNRDFKKLGLAVVENVGSDQSTATIKQIIPRALPGSGDLVVLSHKTINLPQTPANLVDNAPDQPVQPAGDMTEIRVTGIHKKQSAAVAQANVYMDQTWLGASDENGRLFVPKDELAKGGMLRVIKTGYGDFTREITKLGQKKLEIKLQRRYAFVTISTTPNDALVVIDGREIGKTPVTEPIETDSGFVKLSIKAPAGYKDYTTVLEMDQGTLDLTGPRSINLEQNLLGPIESLIAQGLYDQALDKIGKIPVDHSDYLFAQAMAGEIYLTIQNRPQLAAKAYGEITKNPAVQSFSDKRFISAHINEGLALVLTAETFGADQKELALAHYKKAAEILDGVTPHLRFIAADDYNKAVQKVAYYRALSLHRIWLQTQNPSILAQANGAWQNFLNLDFAENEADSSERQLRKNAEVFQKQAETALDHPKRTEKL